MAHLGLGDYGSDEEEELQTKGTQQDDTDNGEPVPLLGSYHSGEAGALMGIGGVDAAPDIQDSGPGGPATEDGSSSPQQAPGEEGMDASMPLQSLAPGQADDDPFALLPAELRERPPGTCHPKAVTTLEGIIQTARKKNQSFIASLRSNRTYSNPDLLQQLVQTWNLPQYGSAFKPEVFDPDGLPPSDFIDKLVEELEREQERRKAARASAAPGGATIAFERGSGALGALPATGSNPNLQAAQAVAAAAAAAQAAAAAGRPLLQQRVEALTAQAHLQAQAQAQLPRKRSKWDSAK